MATRVNKCISLPWLTLVQTAASVHQLTYFGDAVVAGNSLRKRIRHDAKEQPRPKNASRLWHGHDIEATRGDGQRWIIEAKGCVARRAGDHNNFRALLGGILMKRVEGASASSILT